jgi:hypothetical protein
MRLFGSVAASRVVTLDVFRPFRTAERSRYIRSIGTFFLEYLRERSAAEQYEVLPVIYDGRT